jgi:hypothetical protein
MARGEKIIVFYLFEYFISSPAERMTSSAVAACCSLLHTPRYLDWSVRYGLAVSPEHTAEHTKIC